MTRRKSATVEYSGYGDEGNIDDVTYDGESLPETLRDQIHDWVYKALEPLPDWYNNEGGGGTITIDVEAGIVTVDHYTNETVEHHEAHTL